MKGTYLPINYNDWKNVTIKNDNDDSDTGNYSTVSEKWPENDGSSNRCITYLFFRCFCLKENAAKPQRE